MLSKKSQYAFKALTYLAERYKTGPVLISEISKKKKIPLKFLENILANNHGGLVAYTHDEIANDAGSGGHEIRTWIALAGAVQSWKAELLAYEPVVPWATGCGLVAFNP